MFGGFLKQSTAVDVLLGKFVDLTDGYSEETGETPAVLLSKNGQALGAKNDATVPVHDQGGYYNCELDDTDTNTTGTLSIVVKATATARDVHHDYYVLTATAYDSIFGAASAPASISDFLNNNVTAFTAADSVGWLLNALHTLATSISEHTGTDIPDLFGAFPSGDLATEVAALRASLPIRPTKNQAFSRFPVKMKSDSDNKTGVPGLSVTATRSLDGGAFAACANAVVEVGGGIYYINLAAADLNANVVVLRFTASGANTQEVGILTQTV